MKRLAFLSFIIATLIAPIQVQAQQEPVTNCVTFPRNSTPEEQLRYLLAHPKTRVCPSPHPDMTGEAPTLKRNDSIIDHLMNPRSGRKIEPSKIGD
jgi:hypothetical protein